MYAWLDKNSGLEKTGTGFVPRPRLISLYLAEFLLPLQPQNNPTSR